MPGQFEEEYANFQEELIYRSTPNDRHQKPEKVKILLFRDK